MGRTAAGLALGVAMTAMPAAAVEIAESVFQVSYTYEGTEYVFNDTVVPLLPGNACYTWYLRADLGDAAVRVIERFTLPAAIDWGAVGQGTDDTIRIEQGGKVAVTTYDGTTDPEGWFSHGWCVADGDPTGWHSLEVIVDGVTVASFPFRVIAESAYSFPSDVNYPERANRSAHNTW